MTPGFDMIPCWLRKAVKGEPVRLYGGHLCARPLHGATSAQAFADRRRGRGKTSRGSAGTWRPSRPVALSGRKGSVGPRLYTRLLIRGSALATGWRHPYPDPQRVSRNVYLNPSRHPTRIRRGSVGGKRGVCLRHPPRQETKYREKKRKAARARPRLSSPDPSRAETAIGRRNTHGGSRTGTNSCHRRFAAASPRCWRS